MEKIIDIEERIPTLRARRRKRTNIKFIILSVLFFLILLVLVYFQSPYSNVKKITITGSELANEEYYLKHSSISIGDSMWSFRNKEIEKTLAKDDWIKKVTVKRKWLTTVNITIEEWEKVAYTEEDGSFYPMLENGVVYGVASKEGPLDAPLFVDFKDEKIRKRLVKELAKLNPEILALISQINAYPTDSDPYSVRLFMNDGYEVRGVISSLVSKLNYYPSIVAQIKDQPKGIIDLEVGSYYRSYEKEYSGVEVGVKASADEEVEQEVDENAQTSGQ